MERPPPQSDVIAAVATAPGVAGVGVVRVSGPSLGAFAYSLTGKRLEPRRATLCQFRDSEGRPIDIGLALFFSAPHSFTGEDVLELHAHGGPVVLHLLLRRSIELGARLAQPGEFTRRAFLNEKLDLVQAEGVADLIEASTEAAARSAVRSLTGEFSEEVSAIGGAIVELRSRVEAALDFPEEEIEDVESRHALCSLADARLRLCRLVERTRRGAVLRTGLQMVISGQPNVGKSSLLNRLARDERAIVTPVAGTTRDAVRETISIDGIPIRIVDTAGLRDTHDEVERLGVERSWKEIERADAVMLVCDARVGLTDRERAIVSRVPKGLRVLTILNKIDLTGDAPGRSKGEFGVQVQLSAKTGEGMGELEATLLEVAGWQGGAEEVFLGRERHLLALGVAGEHLEEASSVGVGKLELFAEELRLAHAALAEVTGEFTPDDLLGEIFGRFCIGK